MESLVKNYKNVLIILFIICMALILVTAFTNFNTSENIETPEFFGSISKDSCIFKSDEFFNLIPDVSSECKKRSMIIYKNRNNPKYPILQKYKINSLYDAYRWMTCMPSEVDANGNRYCPSFSDNDCGSLNNIPSQPVPTGSSSETPVTSPTQLPTNISKDCQDRSTWVYNNRENSTLQKYKINSIYDAYRWMSCMPTEVDANGNRYCPSFSGNNCESLNGNVPPPIPEQKKIVPPSQYINGNKFPTDSNDKYFSIQFRNSTDRDIIIWLDDMGMCSTESRNDCHMGDPNAWSIKGLGQFMILTDAGNGNWSAQLSQSQRKQVIMKDQVWRVIPPIDSKSGDPYWCMDQPYKGNWNRNCPGVGAWFANADFKGNLPGSIGSRIEYNINGGQLWFNSSAVDAINANFNASYTGCPENERKCLTDLSTCRYPSFENGVKICPAPKFWPRDIINACGTNGIGGQYNLSALDLAEAGKGDSNYKKEYHKWWAQNKCAYDWLQYLQHNKSGKCEQYGWAYDEFVYNKDEPDSTFDVNGNPKTPNPIKPLIQCKLKNGSLNVDILKIMS